MSNSKKLQPKKWWGQKCKKRRHKNDNGSFFTLWFYCSKFDSHFIAHSIFIHFCPVSTTSCWISINTLRCQAHFHQGHCCWCCSIDVPYLCRSHWIWVSSNHWGIWGGAPHRGQGRPWYQVPWKRKRERKKIVKINGSQSFSQGSLKTVLQQSLVKWSSS